MARKDPNTKTIEQLEKDIATMQKKVADLKSAPQLTVTQKLAVYMHDKLCIWNHTDGCSWYYAVENGKHNWNDHAHKHYLAKAEKLMFQVTRRSSAGYRPGDEDQLYPIIDIIAE